MKRLFLLLIIPVFVLDSAKVMGQGWQQDYPGNSYHWGGYGWGRGIAPAITQTQDGGYLFSTVDGYYSHTSGTTNTGLCKIDSQGVLEWDTLYQVAGGKEVINDLIESSDGNYLTVEINDVLGDQIVKYDTQGTILWNQPIPGVGRVSRIIELQGGSMVVLSEVNINSTRNVSLSKHDATGNMIWIQTYGDTTISEWGHDAKATVDGGFIISGGEDWGRVFLIKVDQLGNEEWTTYFDWVNDWPSVNPYGWTYWGARTCVSLRNDGGYIISAYKYFEGHFVHLYKVDGNGVQQWTNRFGNIYNRVFSQFVDSPDGGFVAAGLSDQNNKFYLVKANQHGDQQWYRQINVGGRARTITSTDDGGYVIVGRNSPYAVKVDSVGSLGIPCGDTTFLNPVICDGQSFSVASSTYTQSGMYVDRVVTVRACDSIIVTDLTVLNQGQSSSTLDVTICTGQVFTVGTSTYSVQGTYVHTFSSTGGCDSTVTLNLEVLPGLDSVVNASICDGQPFTVGTYTYNSAGTYVQHYSSSGGCDSTITVNITEGQGYDISLSEMICEGDVFTVGSSTYDQPGVYVDSLVSVGGCDSVITTELSWGLESGFLGFPIVSLSGTVFHDQDGDCEYSAGDVRLDNWVVEADGNQTFYGTTNSIGNYSMIVAHGTYDLSAQTPNNWQHCGGPQSITIDSTTGCFAEADIALEPTFGCAILDLDLSVVCLVPCSTSTYHLNYHNVGTETAYNPTITFAAGPYLTVNWSSVPWETPQSGTIYEFQLDSVPAGASGWIAIAVTVDCDAGLEGYSVCSGALHDAAQCCPQYAQYNGPEIALEAECDENGAVPEIEFRIKNIGAGDMNAPLPFYILQDDVVFNIGTFQLNSQQQDIHTVFATGSMYRMEAQQDPGHPYAPSPAIEVEGCGTNAQGMVSLGYSDILENGDQIPSIDFNCTPVTQTCSCNQLYSSPTGITPQHYVDVDEQIEYTVTFQNQLTTEVQKLVIIDTLPEELDPASIIKGESSHEFEFSVSGNGVVTWTMNDIALAYGMPGTQDNSGFVKFTANLRNDVQVGSVVYNSARLYFDEEEGVTTNETFHTVGRLGVDFLIGLSVDDIKNPDHSLHVFPNPFSQSTTIELKGVATKNVTVEIYDMLGKQIQQIHASDNLIQINRQGMADGVYSYRVMADRQLLGTGKLVVGE